MAVVSPALGKNAFYWRLSTLSVSVLQLHDRTTKLHGLRSRYRSATSTSRSIWRPTDQATVRYSARRRNRKRLLGSLRLLAVSLSPDMCRSSGVRGKESDSSELFSPAVALCILRGMLLNWSATLTYWSNLPDIAVATRIAKRLRHGAGEDGDFSPELQAKGRIAEVIGC